MSPSLPTKIQVAPAIIPSSSIHVPLIQSLVRGNIENDLSEPLLGTRMSRTRPLSRNVILFI